MAGFSQWHSEFVCYFAQESLSHACIGHVTPPLHRESSRREQHLTFKRCWAARVALRHYVKIPTSGIFWVLRSGGCENSSTRSVNQLTSSFLIPVLKLRTYSMEKILSLTGFICTSSTSFTVQAVMLVLLAKQGDTFPRAGTTMCHRTDRLTFISTYGLQILVVPPVT